MFGKKKQKQGISADNQKPDKKALKKQKKNDLFEKENEFEELMDDLDNYN